MTTPSPTWKVGPLAEACGLTVRTLHHWDSIGLLSPSRRTAGGHREYTGDDVARLYQVLALRGLGLGLDTVALCLDRGVDPVRLVGDHLAHVEASLAELELLRGRLVRLAAELDTADGPSPGALFDALAAVRGAGREGERALSGRLDPGQLDVLRDRAQALGPAAHYLLEIEWPELYRRAERLRRDGVTPADARVRRIVARMDELSALFSGGDPAIGAGVRAAWRADPAALSGDPGAPAEAYRALAGYLDRARAAGADA
ncbi:MerR family transcriptional regulator [Streptomyces sp. NBC_01497]|uniref:MerR family transcriptional regulator n=1 Tax=Streptomyces sp. NBC_01497 TaxID=2903885 RepID=UPI002E377F06|nr:MerR family transcriptional regulator [Streptomyces sp. NBC_01497]